MIHNFATSFPSVTDAMGRPAMNAYVATSMTTPAARIAPAAAHFPYGRNAFHAAAVTSSVAKKARTVAMTREAGARKAARILPGSHIRTTTARP
ncbi:hypothetical protein [Streptomyces sp. CC224B]|uniref:hypothetical protein n=1 Tax=Streptomyces sp. CC224B TaxID=3044571 RepID=UPI0024A827E5|nr:hypothetical protein [Streptomyces sp. CC224B]